MSKYRLELAYIGSSFNGWQSQSDRSGVQDHVEQALATFLRHPVRVVGASRTDAGVHAEGQVASFETEINFDEKRWLRALHALMPDSIGVRAIEPVASEFHPIYASLGKAYRYRIWMGDRRLPQLSSYVWQGHILLDLDAMNEALQYFVGTHDFSSFCAADSTAKTRIRTIFEVELIRSGMLLDIWVLGDGFLKQMVRSIVGTLLEVGRGVRKPEEMSSLILAKDRKLAGITAPAHGLSLVKVFYEKIMRIEELRSQDQGFYLRTD